MKNQIKFKTKDRLGSLLLAENFTLEMIVDSADADSFIDTDDLIFNAAVH